MECFRDDRLLIVFPQKLVSYLSLAKHRPKGNTTLKTLEWRDLAFWGRVLIGK